MGKVKDLRRFFLQQLHKVDADGVSNLERIVVNAIERAKTTGDYKMIELVLGRSFGAALPAPEPPKPKGNIPPVKWAAGTQIEIGFKLNDDELEALGQNEPQV